MILICIIFWANTENMEAAWLISLVPRERGYLANTLMLVKGRLQCCSNFDLLGP